MLNNRRKRLFAEHSGEVRAITCDLYDFYTRYGPCPLNFPYTHPAQIEAFLNCVRCGKADTAADAVAVMERDYRVTEMNRTLTTALRD